MKHAPTDPSSEENSSLQIPLKRILREPLRPGDEQSRWEKGHEIWLLTLSDLLLVLLIFFVFLFGITLQQQPPEARSLVPDVAASIKSEETPAEIQPSQVPQLVSERRLVSFETDLRAVLGDEDGKKVILTRMGEHLILTFPETIVFDPGRAQLKPSVQPILDKIALLALKYPSFFLEIQGHADDRPIKTMRYPSNWELSVDRATQVARALIALGLNPAQIMVKGFGEYRALYPNDSDSNRQKNRRVEIQFSLGPTEDSSSFPGNKDLVPGNG